MPSTGSGLPLERAPSEDRYAFAPSVASVDGTTHLAWLSLAGTHTDAGRPGWDVTLATTGGTVDAGRVPRRPTLVGGPDRAHLLWTAETDAGWPLFHAALDGGVSEPRRLAEPGRPPLDVTACRTHDGVAVAWTAAGEASEIRGRTLADGEWSAVETLSTDCDAAYDAALAPASAADDADRYLLYTALRDGWYEVVGRRLVGGDWTDPQVLTRRPGFAAYPTVVAAGGARSAADRVAAVTAPVGPPGAWVGWVEHTPGETRDVRPYVTHQRRTDQHAPFRGTRTVSVHHWDGERVRSPVYSRSWGPTTEANVASGLVPHAPGGTRPALLGGDALRLGWLDYDGLQDRPRIAVSRFAEDRWTGPRFGPVYGDAQRIHHTVVGDTPTLAAGRDTRPAGGWSELEAADHDGRADVGTVSVPPGPDATAEATLQRQDRWVHHRRDARNPSADATSADGRTLLFVDLHRHTDISVCGRADEGELDLNVRVGRDLFREGAVALTDHSYNTGPLARFKTDRAARFYDDADLVTVPSYEWTGTGGPDGSAGHFNVHWFEAGMPPQGVPEADIDPATPERLVAALDDHDAVAIPHHTATRIHSLHPDMWGLEGVPAVEVFQAVRGSCECRVGPAATEYGDADDDRTFVRHALDEGERLGFVAGGDHRGVALTGLWVEEVSRAGVHEALVNRRCFATTGTTLALEAGVAGGAMGEVHRPPRGADAVEYTVTARVPDGVSEVQVLRDGDVVHQFGDGTAVDASVSVERNPDADHDVFARVLLSNGEVAWASPTWVPADD
jgi:hypothetical protein